MVGKKRPGTMVYFNLLEPLEALSMEERGQLFTALLKYGSAGEEPAAFSGMLYMAWLFVKRDMDQDRTKYEATCEKRKAAINKRWENENADEKTGIQMNTNVTDEYKRIQVYTSDTNTIQSNTIQTNIIGDADAPTPKQQKRFIPPTVEEVEAYCEEKGYHIDAQQFVDFYEVGEWKRGKTKIKDWRACVRTWARREAGQANQGGKPTGPQPEILTADNWED